MSINRWRTYRACLGVCLLAAYIGITQDVRGLAQARRVRDIPRGYGARIEQLLRPDDDVVRVVDEDDAILFNEAPSAEELITYLVENSDVIVTVEIAQASGVLVDDGAWIHTQVAGTVREVLKDQNRPLRPGSRFQFQMPGGEMTIGKVLVTTSVEMPHLVIGRLYVVFGEVFSGNGVVFPRHVPMLVEGDMLSSDRPFTLATGIAKDPLDGYSLEKLVGEVRRLLK